MTIKPGLYLKELLLFGTTLGVGVFSAYRNLASPVPVFVPEFRFGWNDIILLVALVLFFIFFSKHQKITRFSFKLFLVLIVFSGINIVASAMLGTPLDIWVTISVVVIFLFLKNVLIHNMGIILGVAGIGSLLGLALLPKTVIVVMVVLSFYDIVAVYITGHMIKMARAMMDSGATFGFIIPSRLSGFLFHKQEAQAQVGTGSQFMILGSGDIGLPVILASSVVRYSVGGAIVVAMFSLIGLFITHLIFVNQRERKPMAALPPIATMSIIGYLVALWI